MDDRGQRASRPKPFHKCGDGGFGSEIQPLDIAVGNPMTDTNHGMAKSAKVGRHVASDTQVIFSDQYTTARRQ